MVHVQYLGASPYSKCLIASALLLALLGVFFVVFGSLRMEVDVEETEQRQLGVVVDAGGSGTRLIVYENKQDVITQIKYVKCEGQGLTKYSDNQLEDLKDKLKICFQDGGKLLPKGKKIPIFFAATAGMRLLKLRDNVAYKKLWNLIRRVIDESDFKTVRTAGPITGFEEGKWAWVAANYLSDSLTSKDKFGTIDFGSSSLQIAFENDFDKKISDDQQILNLDGHNVSIYAHSYLCFGNDEIQRRFLAKLVKTSQYAKELNNPCFFNGFNKTYTPKYLWSVPCSSGNYAKDVLGEELTGPSNTTHTIIGTGKFSQCFNLLKDMIGKNHKCTQKDGFCGMLNTFQPSVRGDFFALSTYYHIKEFLHLVEGTSKERYQQMATTYCSKSFEDVSQTHTPLK